MGRGPRLPGVMKQPKWAHCDRRLTSPAPDATCAGALPCLRASVEATTIGAAAGALRNARRVCFARRAPALSRSRLHSAFAPEARSILRKTKVGSGGPAHTSSCSAKAAFYKLRAAAQCAAALSLATSAIRLWPARASCAYGGMCATKRGGSAETPWTEAALRLASHPPA